MSFVWQIKLAVHQLFVTRLRDVLYIVYFVYVCALSGESITEAPKGAKGGPGSPGLPGLPGIDGSRGPGGPQGRSTTNTVCLSEFVPYVHNCSSFCASFKYTPLHFRTSNLLPVVIRSGTFLHFLCCSIAKPCAARVAKWKALAPVGQLDFQNGG